MRHVTEQTSNVHHTLGRGDKVIATARDPAKLSDLETDSCKVFQLDITDTPEKIQERADEALKLFGRVDVLVNNAALTLLGPVEELGCVPSNEFRNFILKAVFCEISRYDGLKTQFETSVFGTVKVTNAFIPSMRAQQSGDIVIIGSRMAWQAAAPVSRTHSTCL